MVPDRNAVKKLVQKFRTTSSTTNINPRHGVTTVRTRGNNEGVRVADGRSPKRSARRHSAGRKVSSRSLRRISHSDLHYHDYKLNIVQELSERDFHSRSAFCEQFVTVVKEHSDAIHLFAEYNQRDVD